MKKNKAAEWAMAGTKTRHTKMPAGDVVEACPPPFGIFHLVHVVFVRQAYHNE
jgi:hypothetical protein